MYGVGRASVGGGFLGLALLLGNGGCADGAEPARRCREEADGFSWGARRREKVPITDLSLRTDTNGTLVARATREDGTIAANDDPGSYAVLPVADAALTAIAVDGAGRFLALGRDGAAFTNESSQNDLWSEAPRLETSATVRRLAAGANGEFWAVGSAGLVARFDGESWVESHPVEDDLIGVWADATSVWLLSQSAVWRGDGSGDFEDMQASNDSAFGGIAALSSEQVWVVGAAGSWLAWDGGAWAVVDSGTNADLTSAWADADAGVWAAGQGVMLHLLPEAEATVIEPLPSEAGSQRFTCLAGARSPRLAGIGSAPAHQVTLWAGTAEGSLFSRQEVTGTVCP